MKSKISCLICTSMTQSNISKIDSIDSYTKLDDAKVGMIYKSSVAYDKLNKRLKNALYHIVKVDDYNVSILDSNGNGLAYSIVDGTLHQNEFINQRKEIK